MQTRNVRQKNDDGSKTGKGAGISEIYAQAKQAFTPEDIAYVHRISGLPVIVKGIQSPEDAEIAIVPGPQEYGFLTMVAVN